MDRIHADSRRLHEMYSISRTTKGAFSRSIQRMMTSQPVELSIICLSLMSACVLAYAGPDPVPFSSAHTLAVVHDYVFTILFLVETILRCIGLGRAVLTDNWFRFDIVVLSMCIVDLVLRHILAGQNAYSVQPMRMLRLLRAFRVVRLLRSIRFHEKSRNALHLLAKGTWEARFLYLYVICFVSIVSMIGFVWFKDGLSSRCIVVPVALPGSGPDCEGHHSLSDEDVDRLLSGEAWSSVSQAAPILAQPDAHCIRRDTSATEEESFTSLGSYVCALQTQVCARVDSSDIYDRWAWLQSFDNFGACALCILMMLLNQEWASLVLKLLQGTSLIVIPFFVVSSVTSFLLMSLYTGMFYAMFCDEQLRSEDARDGDDGHQHENVPEPNRRGGNRKDLYVLQERDKESDKARVEETLQQNRILQKHGCAASWLYFCWKRIAISLQTVHEFRMKALRVPWWELALYCVALVQFVAGCVFSSYIGQWRLIESGAQVGDLDEFQSSYWRSWSRVRTVCQWLFYVDLASKLVRFGGFLACMRSSFSHCADLLSTIAIMVAGLTWQIPDMTTLRGIRLLSGVISVTSYSHDFLTFHHKLFTHEGDVLHSTLFLFLAALLFQHLSDGLTSENKFFGSWCQSMTSIMRLAADTDLLEMIRARLDRDGVAAVVLIIIFTLFLKTVMAKLIIAAMSSGLEDSKEEREQYQIFLSEALLRYPQVEKSLRLAGHYGYRRILRRARKIRLLESELAYSSYAQPISEKMQHDGLQASKETWEKLSQSTKTILVALCMLDEYVQAREQDEDAKAMTRAKLIQFHDFVVFFQEDFIERNVRRVLTLKTYARLTFEHTKFLFILDLFTLIPIALIVFPCTPDDCWIQTGVLKGIEVFLLFGFNVEFVAKVTAFGFFRGHDAYFRKPQYCFDFLVLILFWLASLNAIDVPVQVVYCIRILRMIHWSFWWLASIRRSMECIVSTLDEIFYITASLFCFICFLCPMALQSYSGRWHYCNDASLGVSQSRAAGCVSAFMSPFPLSANETLLVYKQRSILNADLNFDDAGSSFYTLSVLACGDGWSLVFDRALGWGESVLALQSGVDWSVVPLLVYQYVLFVLVWPATVAAYITNERLHDGSGQETSAQRRWRASVNAINLQSRRYLLPNQIFWKPAHVFSRSPNFNRIVYTTIFINIFATCLEFSTADPLLLAVLQIINLCCLLMYWSEMGVMMLASPKQYLSSGWGLFDVVVNLISTVDLVVSFASAPSSTEVSGSPLQAFRAVRIVRIVKALSSHKNLRLISQSIGRIMLRVRGPAALLVLFMAAFAVIARQMFGSLDDGMSISRQGYSHFGSLAGALIILTRVTLGGGMFSLIKDINILCPSSEPSIFTSTADPCMTSNMGAHLFLLVYAIVCRYILWPLLAANAILGFFEEYDDMMSFLSDDDLHKFEKCWRKLDPECAGYIPTWKLRFLLAQLKDMQCTLHFDPHDNWRMKIMNERIHDIFLKKPLRKRDSEQNIVNKWTQCVARWCHNYIVDLYDEDTFSGEIIYGHVTYKWVSILLLYMREFPHSIPRRPMSIFHHDNEVIYARWVELYAEQILPKFRRRILTSKTADAIGDVATSVPYKQRCTMNVHDLISIPTICMLEHPRFSVEWLAFVQAPDSGFVHADVHGKEDDYLLERMGMLNMDRNDFRSHLSLLWRKTERSTLICKHAPVLPIRSATGAVNGDSAPEPDPFLEFQIELPNYDRRSVEFAIGIAQSTTWLTEDKCREFCSTMTSLIAARIRKRSGTRDNGLFFIPPTRKAEKPPVARIQKISSVSYGVASIADTAMITFEVECCDPQVAQEVARICTQDNINLHLQRCRLPLVKVVAQAKILEPVFDLIETGAGLIASEAKLSLGFDDTIGSDTVTLGFVLQDTCIVLKDAHACYAAALAISTDLALSLNCPEEQIRIQDIFQGPHYMHLTVCITSNETHDSSAQSLGLQLMCDSVNCDSAVRSVLPSIALVQWMPDRSKAGLSQRFLSERTDSSTRSQLSHLDTLRQERSGQEKPGYQRQGTFWGDGILRHAPAYPADSGGTKQQQGSVRESKWNRLRKLHVHITLHDKAAEAHKIFDKMDTDSNGSLTCQEIKKAMLSSGFKEDVILIRLPHLVKSGDADCDVVLSREEFVNYWVHSRDEDPSRLFDRFDLDQNGTLSAAELQAGLLQEGFSDKEILKRLPFLFKQMDVDGDDSISKEEFISKWNSMRDSGFFGSSLGQLTSLVTLPLPSVPALSPALAVLPASVSGAGARGRGEEQEPLQDAAGVFAGLMSATSDVFEAVGRSLLPDHLQYLMMPLPDDDNGPSNQSAGPVDRSRRPISRVPGSVPASMRRKRLSPRELLFRAISPAKSGTSDVAQESRGLAATFRNRLGDSSSGTPGEPAKDRGLTSPCWAPGLPLQISIQQPAAGATPAVARDARWSLLPVSQGDTGIPRHRQGPVEITSPAPMRVAPSLDSRSEERRVHVS